MINRCKSRRLVASLEKSPPKFIESEDASAPAAVDEDVAARRRGFMRWGVRGFMLCLN